jgi:hypothetical protein
MIGELGSGSGIWLGDGGGAGGNAGDRVGDWLDSIDVVRELSDGRLEERELDVDVVKVMVSALFRFRKRPLLSRSMSF